MILGSVNVVLSSIINEEVWMGAPAFKKSEYILMFYVIQVTWLVIGAFSILALLDFIDTPEPRGFLKEH